MQIVKKSMLTGKIHCRQIDVSMDKINKWKNGAHIQDVMPELSADDREFLMTGITPEEWENEYGGDDA